MSFKKTIWNHISDTALQPNLHCSLVDCNKTHLYELVDHLCLKRIVFEVKCAYHSLSLVCLWSFTYIPIALVGCWGLQLGLCTDGICVMQLSCAWWTVLPNPPHHQSSEVPLSDKVSMLDAAKTSPLKLKTHYCLKSHVQSCSQTSLCLQSTGFSGVITACLVAKLQSFQVLDIPHQITP